MTKEEQEKVIQQIEKDICYFTNLDFPILSEKFNRDLKLIKSLMEET